MKNAKVFLVQCENAIRIREYKNAAFQLHQSTEHAYHAVHLVFTGYKTKSHNLEDLGKTAAVFDNGFLKIFPRNTPEDDRLFMLLQKSYIEARYSDTFRITKKELEQISKRIKRLHTLTRKICRQKIQSFVDTEARRAR